MTLEPDSLHVHDLDSTSFSVHGQYLSSDSAHEDSDLSSEPVPIILTHGYSRDRRPDLKQFICHLITNGRDGIPLAMATKDGNASDLATFPQVIREFRAIWGQESEQQPQFYVMDSAFYSQDNIADDWQSLYWICRIPARLSEVKEILSTLEPSQFTDHPEQKNYSTFSLCSSYGGVRQRWLVVRSEVRREAQLKSLEKKIKKEQEEKTRELQKLQKQKFGCQEDALRTLRELEKTLKYHRMGEIELEKIPQYSRGGRPKKGEKPHHYTYQVNSQIVREETLIMAEEKSAGCFIVGTNCLDEEVLSDLEIWGKYQEQQGTEGGFRFLKDPMFFASSVYLKTPRRIMALGMIMTLALMVYSVGQYQIRKELENQGETVPDQKGKGTKKPTLRWILQCFQSVHEIVIEGVGRVIQLTERQKLILGFLGETSQKYYMLS